MRKRWPILLVIARQISVTPWAYGVGTALFSLFFVAPLLTGLILKGVFDQLSGERLVSVDGVLWLCAAFVAIEFVRGILLWVFLNIWPYWWNAAEVKLRANMLRSILGARGTAARRLPGSSGEAVSRFRDDVGDLVQLTDNFVDLFGAILFAIGAFSIMAGINQTITLILVLPLLVILVLTRMLSGLIRRIHRRARQLGAVVTAYVGEVFSGVLAIKTGGAEQAVLGRLREHNRRRRGAAVKDRLAQDVLNTATSATVEVSVGLVLVLSASAMRSGDFTVGDFALFTSYLGWLTMLPQMVGKILYRLPAGSVSVERLNRLMAPEEDADDLSRQSGIWLRREPPALPSTPVRDEGLRVVEIRGLTARHGEDGRGIHDVDLRIEHGSFTVVTGAVGSGKTTLVRAFLGLLPIDSGAVRWNDRVVDDPGTFLVPPRAAYAGQVPRLFSETLRENLALGWPTDDEAVARALRQSVLEHDLQEMPEGLDTVVGPRGVRLSGGQVQRSTAARALVRTPDLMVVDDLSSALDVQTEQLLWNRVADAALVGEGPETLLVVSHRKAALERADQIVVLDRGRVVGVGTLEHLLRDCPEMRRLWSEDAIDVVSSRSDDVRVS